jgi:hypothetical protein
MDTPGMGDDHMGLKVYCQKCKAYYRPLYRAQPCPCKVIDPTTYVPVPTGPAQKARKIRRMLARLAANE